MSWSLQIISEALTAASCLLLLGNFAWFRGLRGIWTPLLVKDEGSLLMCSQLAAGLAAALHDHQGSNPSHHNSNADKGDCR